MEHFTVDLVLLVLAGGFLAAFIDSVAGGGGLISLPVLLMTGLPPQMALGTNKIGGTSSSLTSTLSFMWSGKIDYKLVGRLFPLTLIGAAAGTVTVHYIPSASLKPLVVVLLIAVTVYTLFRKDWGEVATYRKLTRKSGVYMALAAVLMGYYDGFFGPGTGSFLIFIFLMLGFDFVTAAGNAKVLNLASNIASLATFIYFGSVDWRLGLLLACAMIAGSLAGSQVAIRQGAKYVRPLFIGICVLLVGKQLWDMLQ